MPALDSNSALPVDELPVGRRGRLVGDLWGACSDPQLSARLRSLGFVPGTEIRVLRRAPLGGPIEFELRGFRICLRKQDVSGLKAHIEINPT